ncbi:MAG: FMN-binding protein [Treponema sp.]|nr:FMN-binding protein [Treponema sp.]
MKKIILFLPVLFLVICCSTAYKTITYKMPDLTQVDDGVYRGIYDLSGTPVMATLDVTMQDNKIINIEIVKHICSPIGKKAEKIIDNVIERQNLEVDVVSGATGSSTAILKAIENALQ